MKSTRFILIAHAMLACTYCGTSRAADDLQEVSSLLSQGDVLSKGYKGEFALYSAGEDKDSPLDFRLDGLALKAKGRIWVNQENILAEFLGGDETTAVGIGSRYNDISEVLAVSDDKFFDFLPVGSTVGPFANLRVYSRAQPQKIRARLDANALYYLNALCEMNGFRFESLLTERTTVVSADKPNGRYTIHADRGKSNGPRLIDYELTIEGGSAKSSIKVVAGPPTASITSHTLVEAEIKDGAIIPRRVAQKISVLNRDVATRSVAQFTNAALASVEFPIKDSFFKKYERAYGVIQGDATQSANVIDAVPDKYSAPLATRMDPNQHANPSRYSTGQLAFVAINLVVVLAALAWLYIRRSRKDA